MTKVHSPGAATAEPHFLNNFQSRFEACYKSTEYWFCVHSIAASLAVTAIKKLAGAHLPQKTVQNAGVGA
jgi:hypothetical protein